MKSCTITVTAASLLTRNRRGTLMTDTPNTDHRPSTRPKYITGPNAADTVAAASVDYSIGYCQLRRACDELAKGGAGGELTQAEIEKAVDLARQGLQTMVACAAFVGRHE